MGDWTGTYKEATAMCAQTAAGARLAALTTPFTVAWLRAHLPSDHTSTGWKNSLPFNFLMECGFGLIVDYYYFCLCLLKRQATLLRRGDLLSFVKAHWYGEIVRKKDCPPITIESLHRR